MARERAVDEVGGTYKVEGHGCGGGMELEKGWKQMTMARTGIKKCSRIVSTERKSKKQEDKKMEKN